LELIEARAIAASCHEQLPFGGFAERTEYLCESLPVPLAADEQRDATSLAAAPARTQIAGLRDPQSGSKRDRVDAVVDRHHARGEVGVIPLHLLRHAVGDAHERRR